MTMTNVPDFITRQTYVVITCIWRDMGYVAFTHFCRESGFVANTRFFGCILSRLLLRHRGFYSDFVQISVQNIGGWDLCSATRKWFFGHFTQKKKFLRKYPPMDDL